MNYFIETFGGLILFLLLAVSIWFVAFELPEQLPGIYKTLSEFQACQ